MKTKKVKITEGPTKTNIKKDTGGPAIIIMNGVSNGKSYN